MPVKFEAAVVSDGEWHSAHPIRPNSVCPFFSDDVDVVGVGAASNRMKAAKFTVSDDISDAVPVNWPLFRILVESSGRGLNTQPGTPARSLGNASFVTPISTL